MEIYTLDEIEVLSKKNDGFAKSSEDSDIGEAIGSVSKKEAVANEVSDRSSTISKPWLQVTYPYLKNARSALTNTVLNNEFIN